MISRKDMIYMDDLIPGSRVKTMLLYFPNVHTYRIHDNPFMATEDFVFENIKVRNSQGEWERRTFKDKVSKWIELEKCDEILF